ncbi:hypothetical protein Ciccas_009167 [Cichlidogyrus casuarinus]|uniref:Uncharacterized protein n=1 Tax=Cichlidogyrus casuarinus TaxID=1844966 RepID=A0ABD2PY14_9PLAT
MRVFGKNNILHENLKLVGSPTFTLSDEASIHELMLRNNGTIILDRGSGFKIKLVFESVNLRPALREVDHSKDNDNHYRKSHKNGYDFIDPNIQLKFCRYPVPPGYRIDLYLKHNVSTSTVVDRSLPGYRSVAKSCKETSDSFNYLSPYLVKEEYPTISCLEPSSLISLFDNKLNDHLSSRVFVYTDDKSSCVSMKEQCAACLERCANKLNPSNPECKPSLNRADNGRSNRLAVCFDCCAREECSKQCLNYAAQRCTMKLCSLDRPVYRFTWSVWPPNSTRSVDEFSASLMLSSKDPPPSGVYHKILRGLLNVEYLSGLRETPDLISGNGEVYTANIWSKHEYVPVLATDGPESGARQEHPSETYCAALAEYQTLG